MKPLSCIDSQKSDENPAVGVHIERGVFVCHFLVSKFSQLAESNNILREGFRLSLYRRNKDILIYIKIKLNEFHSCAVGVKNSTLLLNYHS